VSRALYRKYRSKSLSEIVGQAHVTDILSRSLKQGKVAHAYLLTGPRGIGKTSIARILAHEINQLEYTDDASHLDIIEIDAASNNGVEDVRDLREKVQIAPVSAVKKIYIIDEVHMLSKAAFNALLKTLEEPPEHAVFILATTDIEKLPATIISRTQRFHLRSITPADATKHLRYIAKEENIPIDDEALELIAVHGEGSFRDSISLLDQLSGLAIADSTITKELVQQVLGLAPDELVQKVLAAYETKDLTKIVELLKTAEENGIQATAFTHQLVHYTREHILETPQLLPLLDKLLEVAKSSQPTIKLLIILAEPSLAPRPKSAALSAPVPVIEVPIAALKGQKPITKSSQSSKKTEEKTEETQAATPPRKTKITGEFNWPKLIEYMREHHVAVFSVLAKCSHKQEGESLRIYTGNAFYKKKLDDTKYRIALAEALIETGAGEFAIETIPTPPPPKDSKAAAIAAIMGGGEEVTVDATL
jgi:DNA polymerase-3 subunit gamma/tau